MELGIIGLPQSGKSTVFNALTRGQAETRGEHGIEGPRVGVAKVRDPRIERMSELFPTAKKVYAEVQYVDMAAMPGDLGKTQGIAGRYLNLLQKVDALLLVVRVFDDPTVSHPEGSIDPDRDLQTMQMELAFADLGILERRVERLANEFKGAKPPERAKIVEKQAILEKVKKGLEDEVALAKQPLNDDERKLLADYQLLTAKPVVILWNVGEEGLDTIASVESGHSGDEADFMALCGKLEMELGRMELDDETEFRRSMGLTQAARDTVVERCYHTLGYISFLTAGDDEVRAWTIERDLPAVKAAGKIHSDLERGFIRAEVCSFEELDKYQNFNELKKLGLLRREGKTYTVRDGDVMNVLFNV
ncbi:MAG: hypothetical protein C1O27_001809 [Chloroflexi bacterium]|jgi:hypothetical protein|nr:MAG: hypothetical protein C1O27_001809 [Chloroflexota bacterium]